MDALSKIFRIEKDLLGEKQVPADVYWGVHTQRALENFKISDRKVDYYLINALAMVKKAAAKTNCELGYLDNNKADAIIAAAEEIISGNFGENFPLDVMQGGAGTSTNMNVNEVIANRAIEILGGKKGQYAIVHPLDDVNKHQSTNDVYPTAIKIAAIIYIRKLNDQIVKLQGIFQKKEKEFAKVLKLGRTELQEAVPISLGAEFSAFAEAISRDRWRTMKSEERLRTVNIGGTVLGTGLGAPRKYIFLIIEKLREETKFGLSRAENLLGDTATADVFVEVSGIIKAHASNLVKISNDLRLLNSYGEIILPKVQAGSSIMPGKVNPVILEAVIQAGITVFANDGIISDLASRGSLQINEFLPLLGNSLLESLKILCNINEILANYVVQISVNKDICQKYVNKCVTLITCFVPFIGYEKCQELIGEFKLLKGVTLKEFLKTKIDPDLVERTMTLENYMALGFKDEGVK